LKRPGRKLALRVALVLATALLSGQWAAQAHAYSHVPSQAAATHPLDSKGQACPDCLSFAPLLATAAGSSPTAPCHAQGTDEVCASVPATPASRAFPASFRSRAPPRFR
jgi:hypothetical protein